MLLLPGKNLICIYRNKNRLLTIFLYGKRSIKINRTYLKPALHQNKKTGRANLPVFFMC